MCGELDGRSRVQKATQQRRRACVLEAAALGVRGWNPVCWTLATRGAHLLDRRLELRREVHGLEIVIHRVDTLSPRTDTPAFPEVIAWQVDTENYTQILRSLSKYRCLNRKSLQVALVSDSSLTAGFCGLREAGAFHIQVGWYSSSLLNHILTRYWEIHANPPQAPLDEVIRLLPLRSR